jgi:hypothetical protein
VPPVLLAFCSHAQKQLSDGNKGVAVRNLAPGFFQGGPIGRVFHADVQTLHELVTLQPQSCTKFERALTPELFHYDGVIVHYLDLHYLQPYWKDKSVTRGDPRDQQRGRWAQGQGQHCVSCRVSRARLEL